MAQFLSLVASSAAGEMENNSIMISLKIQCGCGQRYAFDVEPVGAAGMPSAVTCPACGADGTAAANAAITQIMPAHAGGRCRGRGACEYCRSDTCFADRPARTGAVARAKLIPTKPGMRPGQKCCGAIRGSKWSNS